MTIEVITVLKRNKILFLFFSWLIFICFILYVLREPLLPFSLGFLVAYLLLPLIDWIERLSPIKGRWKAVQRIVLILMVFLVLLAALLFLGSVVISSFGGSFSKFLINAPALISDGLDNLGRWIQSFIYDLTPEQQKQAESIVDNVGTAIGNWLQGIFMTGLTFISSTFTFVVGFLTLPFFLIMFMQNVRRITNSFYSLFSEEVNYHWRNLFRILNDIFGRYIRAQFLLALIMGTIVYLTLLILDIDLAPALGFIAGVFQLIPAIGGAFAGIIGIIVTLALAPDKIIAVIIAYIVINLVIGSILIAKISGNAVNIDASIVMVLIVIGGYLGGILGMILISPIVAILFALYKYISAEIKRSQLEEA